MFYRIAEFVVEIVFNDTSINGLWLIPSFSPFRIDERVGDDDFLFRIVVDDSLAPRRKDRERIGKFDTGNGDTCVDRFEDGAYQFIIKDISGNECCLLQTNRGFTSCRCALNGNSNMRQFGLNNALMLVFAFAGSFRRTVLVHASLVRQNGYGYAFIAKSGTGKSTQVSNWLKYIPGCDLMNDDNPIIRIIQGNAYIYGSPWSGKTPCYRNVKARLGAITRISRDERNWVEQQNPVLAFASVLPSCSTMKWDSGVFNAVCDTVTEVLKTTGIYTLHCLPDRESAIVCNAAITKCKDR